MRLPRVRFTVRRMMIVVALVAIALGSGIAARRNYLLAIEYRQLAATFASMEQVHLMSAWISSENKRLYAHRPDAIESLDEQVWRSTRVARHYSRLRQKYLAAADRPWATIRPDPPEPK